MNRTRIAAVGFALILVGGSRLGAVVIEKIDGTRIVGFLVSADANQVVIRPDNDGSDERITIPRSEIEFLLKSFDPARLEELDPSKPAGYRDYAEELAEKRGDPEALEVSRRLYLLAATLDPERLGRGALLGLAAISEEAGERRKARAVAYLLDPRHDRSILSPDEAAANGVRRGFGKPGADLADALRQYRNRQFAEARKDLERPGVEDLYRKLPGLPPWDAFKSSLDAVEECERCDEDGRVRCATCKGTGRLATSNPFNGVECPDCEGWGDVICPECDGRKADLTIPEATVRAFLRAEITLIGKPTPARRSGPSEGLGWSAALREPSGSGLGLDLASVSDIDTTLSVYRDGQWTRPKASAVESPSRSGVR